MLDPATGAVELRPGLTVRDGTPAADLQAQGSASSRYGNGWGWENLEVHDGELRWFVQVSIGPRETAERVVLAIANEDEPADWSTWTEEAELERRDRHDAWLVTQLGDGWATDTYDGASKGSSVRYAVGRGRL